MFILLKVEKEDIAHQIIDALKEYVVYSEQESNFTIKDKLQQISKPKLKPNKSKANKPKGWADEQAMSEKYDGLDEVTFIPGTTIRENSQGDGKRVDSSILGPANRGGSNG